MYDFVNLNFLPQIPIELLCLHAKRPSNLFMGAVNKKPEPEHPVFRYAVLVYRLVLCEKGGHAAGAHAVLRLGGGGRPSLSNTTVPSQVLANSAQNIGEDTAETSRHRGSVFPCDFMKQDEHYPIGCYQHDKSGGGETDAFRVILPGPEIQEI